MTIIATAQPTADTASRTRVTWRAGLATGVVAAAAVTALAGVLHACGAPLGVDGEAIPLLGFAQMVLTGAVIGIVLARHTTRSIFLRTTIVLTALSCVPSIALGTGVADKLGLALTHVVAAAIIVPRLAPHR